MKPFQDIINEVSKMRWSIVKRETSPTEADTEGVTQAIQQANNALWGMYDFDFKRAVVYSILEVGQTTLPAPKGRVLDVMVTGGSSYLRPESNPDFLPKYSGTPNKYWVEGLQSGNVLHVYPTPDVATEIRTRYVTIEKAVGSDGVAKANLEEVDDVLNIQPEYEEMYLNALKNKAMCYLIADETDENYKPYLMQFEEQVKLLLNLQGVKADNYVRIY